MAEPPPVNTVQPAKPRKETKGEKAARLASVREKMAEIGDCNRILGLKSWTALSKEKLLTLKVFAEKEELDVTGCARKEEFVRVVAAYLQISRPGAAATSSATDVGETPASAHPVVPVDAPTEAPPPAAPVATDYEGNPGLDSQVVASLQPEAQGSGNEWESGTADDALLAELPEDIRADAGELLNSYEADDGEEEEGLVELDEEKEPGSFEKQLRATMQHQHDVIQGSRRPGAISTDRHCVKMIERFTTSALGAGIVRDSFVDEQFITEFLKHSAERERMTPQGVPIPGTRVGSAQLRKLFFGALRYRLQQAATIDEFAGQKDQRPAASRQLTKYLKALMHQAVVNLRMGETEGEDAQDVQAGTILDRLTNEEEERLGSGFLAHSNLAMCVKGQLVWTLQRATGMRGDDIRSMYLAATQPYDMMLPLSSANIEVPAIVLLQWNHKTDYTTSDQHPKFHTVITHKDPLYDAHSAFALYFHWLFDVYEVETKHEFDWTLNKTWRQVRLVFGASCTTQYSEGSLYNLFNKAYSYAGLPLKHKSSLQRHLMGKHHEEYGVAQSETERMGWASGVYAKHYANPIAKHGVLGSAGFSKVEQYDPVWSRVVVPERFLKLVCPQAEARMAEVQQAIDNGNSKIRGTLAFWKLVIRLRPRAFLGAAAIRQKYPDSAIFRLPALSNPEVIDWMDKFYPEELAQLQGDSRKQNLDNIQSELVAEQLAALNGRFIVVEDKLNRIMELLTRRTAILSPSRGINDVLFTAMPNTPPPKIPSATRPDQLTSPIARPHLASPTTPSITLSRPSATAQPGVSLADTDAEIAIASELCEPPATAFEEEEGTYIDKQGQTRAFAFPSPAKGPRQKTDVDPILPSHAAWAAKGHTGSIVLPPVFGRAGVHWDSIFKFVQNPLVLWKTWKPKNLGAYSSLLEVWNDWDQPRIIQGKGQKPPLKLIEGRWPRGAWGRTETKDKKHWSNFKVLIDFCKDRLEKREWSWEQIDAFLAETTQPVKRSKNSKQQEGGDSEAPTQAIRPTLNKLSIPYLVDAIKLLKKEEDGEDGEEGEDAEKDGEGKDTSGTQTVPPKSPINSGLSQQSVPGPSSRTERLLPSPLPQSDPDSPHAISNVNANATPAPPLSPPAASPSSERAHRLASGVPRQLSRRPPPVPSRKRIASDGLSGAAKRQAIDVQDTGRGGEDDRTDEGDARRGGDVE